MVGTRARHAAEPRPDASGARSRPGIRRLAALLAAVVGAALLVTLPAQTAGAASQLIAESFTGTSVADPAWKPLGSACLTRATSAPASGSSTLGVCSSRNQSLPASANPGALQLTDNRGSAVGGVVYDNAIPASGGLDIKFDQYQYGTSSGGADGIGFFLTDGSVPLTAAGPSGGSLGYAQTTSAAGVAGGYLGVGLDAFGNFSNPTEGRGTGCATGTAGVGQRPNAIALRGPGQGTVGYCYLTGTSPASSLRATTTLSTPTTDLGRTIRITVSPARLPVVTVYVGATAGASTASLTQVVQYTMTTPAPSSYKLGYLASTGSFTDTHLIREVSVSSVADLTPLTLVKQVDRTTAQPAAYAEGQAVPYQFVITNTGGLTLSNLAVNDPLVSSISCPGGLLGLGVFLSGRSVTCTGVHVVTPAEAVLGTLTNTATATGVNTLFAGVTSNTSSVTVPIATPAPALALTKTGALTDSNGNGRADVGERIAYSFAARNAGNVTLQQVAVADPRVTGISPASVTLAPGASQTFTSAAYTVTQADVDAATPIVNTATVSGQTLAGVAAPTATSSTSTPVSGSAALTLTKGATLTGGSVPGATVAYSFSVKNTGTVPLTGVALTDPLPGLSAVTYTWPGTAGTLAAGATATATASYTVRQADVDAGQIANTATVRGASSGGVQAQATATRTVTLDRTATMAFTKTATPGNVPAAGGVVTYAFRLQNTGSTTLTGVSIADPRTGVSALTYTWPGTAGALAPGQVVTATATYTATTADVTAGSIVNTATATATAPTGTVSRTATATVLAVPDPLPDAATTPQGVPVVVDVLANDGPAATGATLSRAQLSATPTLVGGAAGPVPASPTAGSATCAASGTDRGRCTYRSAAGFTGVDVFDYALQSGAGTWNVRVTITVTPVNRTAVARADRLVATVGGPDVTIDPRANDTDVDGDALAITGATPPAALPGSFSCTAALCTYRPPAAGTPGSTVVAYAITDRPAAPGTGTAASSTITVHLDPAPLVPRGFTHRDDATLGASTGTWTSTTTVTAATASCVAGRPVTALAWTAVPDATDQLVERRLAGTTPGAWITVARVAGTVTAFSDDRLGESRSYQWRVRPDLQRWVGVPSAPSTAVAQPAAVSAAGC
ncbi:cell wall anchor protein [Clavibacter michiganensis subsp. phaseoli]|uniref:Cell wall anchor protein n=1 Tax=Clavibacter phaseoli TaxID=1734031 RepID=A0A8I0S966_9MICO|nr:cell wall anchor protein [Clavibacter phaseoli]